jgi:hypothetical protein
MGNQEVAGNDERARGTSPRATGMAVQVYTEVRPSAFNGLLGGARFSKRGAWVRCFVLRYPSGRKLGGLPQLSKSRGAPCKTWPVAVEYRPAKEGGVPVYKRPQLLIRESFVDATPDPLKAGHYVAALLEIF